MYEIKIPFTHCGNGIFFCEKLKKVQFAMYICEKVCYNKYINEAKPFSALPRDVFIATE